jgi:hypothetical protein
MSSNRRIMIEGYTAEELLGLPGEQIDDFVLSDCPTFGVGSARILGEFKIENDSLVVELAHIDGDCDGVPADALVCSVATRRGSAFRGWSGLFTLCIARILIQN